MTPKDNCTSVTLTLPDWLPRELDRQTRVPDENDQMALAIRLSARNVEHGGGPFAAVIFDRAGRPLAAGVNQVTADNCSLAHAEIMAIIFAQARLRRFRLNSKGGHERYTLVSSAQPCLMCFGAILWAGLDRVIYGACREDVEQLTGFDEGPLPLHWREEWAQRGIETVGGLLRRSACSVLQRYREGGGLIY